MAKPQLSVLVDVSATDGDKSGGADPGGSTIASGGLLATLWGPLAIARPGGRCSLAGLLCACALGVSVGANSYGRLWGDDKQRNGGSINHYFWGRVGVVFYTVLHHSRYPPGLYP